MVEGCYYSEQGPTRYEKEKFSRDLSWSNNLEGCTDPILINGKDYSRRRKSLAETLRGLGDKVSQCWMDWSARRVLVPLAGGGWYRSLSVLILSSVHPLSHRRIEKVFHIAF